MNEQNEELVKRWHDEGINQQNADLALELCAENFQFHFAFITSWSLIKWSLDSKPSVFLTTQHLTTARPIGRLGIVSRMCLSLLSVGPAVSDHHLNSIRVLLWSNHGERRLAGTAFALYL